MATRTSYMTMFEQCGTWTAEQIVNTERGLGDRFTAAVKQLLAENPDKSNRELVAVYMVAIEAMEDTAKEVLVEHFGEGATLTKYVPNWKDYKSTYKRLLSELGGEAAKLEKLGVGSVKAYLAEKNKTPAGEQPDNKGPGSDNTSNGGSSEGNTDIGGGSSNSGDAGKTPEHAGLPKSVQSKIDNAMNALAKMSEADALAVASNFEAAAWKSLRTGNRKAAITTKAAA